MKTRSFFFLRFTMKSWFTLFIGTIFILFSFGSGRFLSANFQDVKNNLLHEQDTLQPLEDFLEKREVMREYGVSELVNINRDGELVYGRDDEGNRISDFSYAGYKGGGVVIPDVPAVLTVYPGNGEDDTKRLQEAIDRVSAMPLKSDGFRGAVVLKKGRYKVTGTLYFHTSGVVVRGEGAGFGGTWIYHRPPVKDSIPSNRFPHQDNVEKGVMPTFRTRSGKLQTQMLAEVTQGLVPAGINRFAVSDISSIKPGDKVMIYIHHTQQWVNDLGQSEQWQRPITLQLPRIVKAVYPENEEIELNVPVTSRIDRKSGYATAEVHGIISDERLHHIGLEDILLLSSYDRSRKDKGGYFNDENHPNVAFKFEEAVNGWMRRCAGFFYSKGMVATGGSQHLTIEDCAMIDGVSRDTPVKHAGSRKYYFNAQGEHILFQRCYGRYARHAFIGNGPRGGCVFLDCFSEKDHNKNEWHQRWGHGYLYDNVYQEAQIGLAGNNISGHGQRAAFALAWNNVIDNPRHGQPDLYVNRIPGIVQNYAIGNVFLGSGSIGILFDYGEIGYVESNDHFVQPRSIYLTQLSERLGEDAVRQVTVKSQLNGKRGAVWVNLVRNFSHFPEWPDPEQAPWEEYEDWLPVWGE
jgi:hypothetical protein